MKRTGKNLLKSMLAFVTTIALVLGALPIDGLVPVSQAEEPEAGQTLTAVSYLDKDGQEQTCESPGVLSVSGGAVVLSVSGDETVLSDSESAAELTPGWYYVSENIDFENSVILKGKNGESADYHIILADDVTMNIGTKAAKITGGVGLGCSDTEKTGINLSIYAQSTGDDAGQLNIYNGSNTTSINVDHLTINGGEVTANADAVSAANAINANDFTINGGEVTATAAAVDNATAINANKFTINGGEVTANGNFATNASGFARANAITVNDFKINDGKVTASAAANGNGPSGFALYSTGVITIKGGTINANTSGWDGYVIFCDNNAGGITVNGGKVTAVAKGMDASGIKASGSITINDGKVTAEALGGNASSGIKASGPITINDGEVKAEALGGGTYDYGITSDGKIRINGGQVTAKGSKAGVHSQYNINGESPLYLSWKNATDFVETNSFLFESNGSLSSEDMNVAIEPGKTFTDGSNKYYIAANASEVKDLTNVKLSASTDAVYAVTFDCGGYETVPATQIVKEGNKVTTPPDPAVGSTYNGKSFAGWYQDTACQIRYDFNSKVTSDLYLHAKWANKSNSINDASVKQIYRHTGINIDPVVQNNVGETLTKGKDYEVTIKKSGETGETVSNMNDAGFYELTVTGKGTYSRSKTVRVCVLTFSEYNPQTGVLNNNATLPEGKDAAVVTADTVAMYSGWYVVTDNVEVTSRIKVNGDVHLVLCDGKTLNAAGEKSSSTYIGGKGISVTEGNSLTIYSQAGNTGKLIAKSNEKNYYAGIGGDCPADRTYNSATQSYTYAFPYLTGTENGNAGDITIHGGEIIARGSMYSAAIGKAGKSGTDGKGGRITIYGGKITAERFNGNQYDTGIGGRDADIHISHCRINDDFILSDGYQGSVAFDKPYVIEGATAVFVDSDNINEAAGKKILPVESTESHTVTFNSNGGTEIEAQSILLGKKAVKPVTPIRQGYQFGGWYKNSDFSDDAYNFTSVVTGDMTLHAKWTPVSSPISYIDAEGQTINSFADYSPMEADYTVLPSGSYYVGKDIILLERIKVEGVVNLILGDGYTLIAPMGISVMGENTTLNILCQSGGTGKLSAIAASKEFYEPSETKNKLLTGLGTFGYTATDDILSAIVESEGYLRKYEVSGNEKEIFDKIYIKGSGLLSGLNNNAAIGGDATDVESPNGATGTINIYGGTINAWGGTDAAAIGGGKNNINYGKIHIYGGDVAVLSVRLAAGIGSGFIVNGYGNDGAVGIYGGKVRVIPDSESTGIGGGKYAYGGDIRILGGQVEVKTVNKIINSNKSEAYAIPYWGIGDGYDYEGEKSLIMLGCGSGDSVYAEGCPYGDKPGDGYNGIVRIVPKQVLQVSGTPSQKYSGEISNPKVISAKELVHSHTHVFTYTVSGGTLSATCSDTNCEQYGNPATLTLSAPEESDLVYDGTEKPVIVTGDRSISGYAPVYYQKKDGNTWGEKVTAAPKEAGTYLVSLTVEDEEISNPPTASVEYTIRKRGVTITGLTASDKIYDDTTAVTIDRTNMRLDNKVDGDDVRIVSGEAAFERPDAATVSAVVFMGYSLAGGAAGNYQLVSQPTTLTATIMKRPVTIKAEDQIARCGGAIKEMAATFDQEEARGILTDKGHELTALTLTPDPDPRTLTEPATGGTITPTGAVIKRGDEDVTANYDITYENGSLEVVLNKAEVTKNPTAATGLKYAGYKNNQWLLLCPGEATTKMEYCVRFVRKGNGEWLKNEDGTLVKDNAAPTEGYGEDYSAWEAGTYYVYYRAAADDSHLPSEPGCITVEIGTVPLIVTVSDATMIYCDEFPTMDVAVSGFVAPGEKDHIGSLEYKCSGTNYPEKWYNTWEAAFGEHGHLEAVTNVTYGVKARYTGGDVTACYDIRSVPGFLTVKLRTVSLEWGSTSFTYNGESHVPTVTASNLPTNAQGIVFDQVNVDVSGAQVNAGQYTATVTSLSGKDRYEYKLPTGNLTKVFSIEKADYTAPIPPVELYVPVSATSFTASVAGKMPRDAGTLTYRTGTVTYTGTAGSDIGISGGDFVAAVDKNGLVTVTQIRSVTPPAGAKITVPVHVTSTNYNDKTITVEATFVGKSQAGITVAGDGVSIGANRTLSVEYDDNKEINLSATVDPSGTGGTWVWESSNPEVATVTGNGAGCKVNIIGGGTTGITAKYDDDTKTGQVTLFLTVNPKSIPIPMAREGLVYFDGDGKKNVQTGVASEDEHVIITGGSDYRVGDHVATAVLSDPVTYRWSDGTTDVKYIPWRIEKMAESGVPTGLVGVAPTTWENKDGKIKANDWWGGLEYSTDENFRNAITFISDSVEGLTPGTYYVRWRETIECKAGPALKVVIDACPVPAVRARQGLVYNGSAQALVETDASSRGKIYYAVTEKGYPEPAAGQYTTSIPTATASGSHFVWYKIVGNGNPNAVAAENMQVTIAKKEITVGGIKAGNKVYDGTKNAALDTSGVTLTGKAGGDKLGVTATGTFLSESVGTEIQVDISDLTLTGKDAANYFLAYGGQQKTTTANITARPISGAVTISGGTAAGIQAGDTLTATLAPANTSVFYQWLIDEVEQDGATSASFTIPAGTAVGAKISVRVSGTGNYAGSLTSSEIEIGKKTMGDATVTVEGDGSVGAVLRATVDVGSSRMTGEDYSLVWCRDGVAIEDATGDTYTVDGADRGHTISVKVMAGGEFSGEIVSAGKAIPAGTPVVRAGASAGNAQATVSWTVDTAGQEISRYQVICVETGLQKLVEPGVSSCTFTGLTNGTAYSFIVTAVYGDSSVESDPTAAVRPTAPSSAGGGPSGTGGSGGGSGSGGGGSSGESGSGTDEPSGSPAPNEDPSASAAPGAGPEPGPGPEPTAGSGTTTAPTIVEQRTETTNNPDGTTTTTTTTTDSEGTKTVVAETVKTDGSVEKVTDVVKADGSTEKTTEISHPNGSSEKTVDIVKADGSTIHEEVKTTAKGKVTATVVEVSPAGDRTVTESVTKPNGNYEKTTSETVVKKDEDGNIIGETTTIRTEEKTGKTTQTATYQVVDSSKHVIKLTEATTTAKNGVVTIPKTVKADGTTYKITTLAKGMLKGGETKPKKVALQAGSIKTVQKGAFDNLAKKGTILIAGTKKQFKELKKLIEKSGLPKGVKVKRA